MTHAVRIEPHVLNGCPANRVVEVGDHGELVQVVCLDYELRAGETLQRRADNYAALMSLQVIQP